MLGRRAIFAYAEAILFRRHCITHWFPTRFLLLHLAPVVHHAVAAPSLRPRPVQSLLQTPEQVV